ncbi:MAG: hypothetical protein E6265_25920 [Enterobacteriaceae bacterium]|nr:hypothetical protein [Enterobacteriaceae bacterium]
MTTQYTLEDLREIAYRGSYDDMQRSLARALLAAYEQEPSGYLYRFKREVAPTHWNYAAVLPEHIMPDNNYEIRPQFDTHPAPSIPAQQGDFDFERYNDIVWLDAVASQPAVHGVTAATVATLAIELNRRLDAAVLSIPAVPENPPFAVMQRALDAFYAESDEVPENQMLAAYRVFHSAMLNGGKS